MEERARQTHVGESGGGLAVGYPSPPVISGWGEREHGLSWAGKPSAAKSVSRY